LNQPTGKPPRILCNIGIKKEIAVMQEFMAKLPEKSTVSWCNFKYTEKNTISIFDI